MAYWRLLRVYYRLEKPIAVDTGHACRMVRARTSGQKQAVETVLREFFDLQDDGWHNKRADEEIAAYHRLVDHNRNVGALGGRPRKPNKNPSGSKSETRTVSKNNPNQEPRTKNQENQGAFAPPDWVPADAWTAWLEVRRKKRVPNTDEALRLSVLDLERFRDAGHDPRAVLEQSTKRGWQGLFELNAESRAAATPMQAVLGNCPCGEPATMKVGGKPRCQAHIRGLEAVA